MTTSALSLRFDPTPWISAHASVQGAIVRRLHGYPVRHRDAATLRSASETLVAHLQAEDQPRHRDFQQGYGEYLIRQRGDLRQATARVIADQFQRSGRIGHYELYAALVMGDQEPEVLLPTLRELERLLSTWNNEGWCPWTPALWLRILWLGRDHLDASDAIEQQLHDLAADVDGGGCLEGGRFAGREPLCLMHAVGLIEHPVAHLLSERFAHALLSCQQPDGGWGDDSYFAHVLLRKWDLL